MATLAEVITQADKVRRLKERKDELQSQKQALQAQIADINNKLDVVNGSLAALPFLRMQGGALINMGSEASETALALQGFYVASKHAIKGYTDALRIEIEELDDAPISITLIQPTAVNTPYPEHAKNYLPQQPKLPGPTIDPEQVAEAVLKAATEGGCDVKVGVMATVNTTMASVLPSLSDKFSATISSRQQADAPPLYPDGSLYAPGLTGHVHGMPPEQQQQNLSS